MIWHTPSGSVLAAVVMVTLVLGAAVVLASVTPLLVIGPLVWVMNAFVRMEEKSLEETFGDEYREYAGHVRRWL